MRIRYAALAALAAALVEPGAFGGVIIGGSGPKLATVHAVGVRGAALHAHVKALVWTDRGGHTWRESAPSGLNLDGPAVLVPPAGDWVDVTLILDGPVALTGTTLAGDPIRLSTPLDTWTVPLETPGDGPVALDLALPANLTSPAALAAALQDGAIVR